MEPEYELSILSSEFSDIFVSTNVSWKIEDNNVMSVLDKFFLFSWLLWFL